MPRETQGPVPSGGRPSPGEVVIDGFESFEWSQYFPIYLNLADLLIRHCSSNHKRETIAWSKRRQGAADRLAIFLVWRNYVKPRREKERGSPTPAMMKGITDRPLTPEEIFSERIFRTHADLPPRWAEYYDRAVETRPLRVNRKHELKYAY